MGGKRGVELLLAGSSPFFSRIFSFLHFASIPCTSMLCHCTSIRICCCACKLCEPKPQLTHPSPYLSLRLALWGLKSVVAEC